MGADEAIGWVSLQGNQGTVYLEEIAADVRSRQRDSRVDSIPRSEAGRGNLS